MINKMYEGPIITCEDFMILSAKIALREVEELHNRLLSAYPDPVTDCGIARVKLDIEDLEYIRCALRLYQNSLQEVIKDGQNKEL